MARRRLSDQQKARIAKIQERRRLRAETRAEADRATAERGQHDGRVIVRHGRSALLRNEAEGDTVLATLRANLGEVVCGDRVVWQRAGDDDGVVVAVQPRETALSRTDAGGQEKAIAANITQLVVVLASQPEPAGYLLDQYLVAAERIGVRGLVCLNKSDLLDASSLAGFVQRYGHYDRLGYPVCPISARTGAGLDALRRRLDRQTSILVGQSGVGKSSLINALLPEERVEEGTLSGATGLGRHTTSTATLYHLDSGGDLIDSPGVRSFRLDGLTRADLAAGFREFVPRLGACRFHNCQHLNEPGCAVAAAADAGEIHPDRLSNYRRMAETLRA
jgi:ribosome biogenesis GTPase